MNRKPAHSENKTETETLLDQVISLQNAWHEHDLKHRKQPDMDGEQSDNEGRMLTDYWRAITTKIVNLSPSNEAELNNKLRCMVLLNSMEDVTFQDRIDASEGMHDEIAWSIVRDLANARLNLSETGLPPRFTGRL